MAATIGAARVELSANSAKFESDLARARAAVAKFDKSLAGMQRKFRSTGRKMQRIGRDLQQKVSLPLAAIGGLSLKAASDFQSAFTGVRKTVNATEAEYAQLRSQILQMSKDIPASAAEIAGVTEVAGQLGVRGVKNLMTFTRTAIDMGNATDVAAGDAATAMARIDTIMGGTQNTFDRLGAAVVDVGNNFATTESRIFDASQRLAGVGKVANLTQADIVGIAGAITSTSDRVESSSTAISKVISKMTSAVSTGGEQLQRFANIAGMSADQFRKAFRQDAAGALVQFIEGLERVRRQGRDVFGVLDALKLSGERASQNILALAGANDTLRNAISRSNKAWGENTALTTEAEQRYKTFNSRVQKTWNRIVAVGVVIGDKLMPVAERLMDVVDHLTAGFERLSPATQKMILLVGGLAAVLPPLIAGLGFLTSTILPAMITGMGILTGTGGLIAGAVAVVGLLAGAFVEHNMRVNEATEKQQKFIEQVKKGNKTLSEARKAVAGLTLTDELSATRQMTKALRQQIEAQKELIRQNRKGGTMEGMSIDELRGTGAARAQDMQKLFRLEEELRRMEERNRLMTNLIESEKRLERARQIAEQTNSSVAKQDIANLEAEITKLKQKLGMIEQINNETEEAAERASSQTFSAGIGFNFSDLPLNELRTQFSDVFADLQSEMAVIESKSVIFPDFDASGARIEVVKSALTELVERGVDPTNEAIQELLDKLNQLNDPIPVKGLEKYKVAVEDMRSVTEIALGKTGETWENTKNKVIDVGERLNQFLATEIAGSINTFAESVGRSLAGVENSFATGFEKIMLIALDFASSLARVLTAIGTAMMFIPGMQGQGAALIAGGATLTAISAGLKAGIEKRIKNREARHNERQANLPQMATGGVVPPGFPNDTYIAGLSSGETVFPAPNPLPARAMGGREIIENHLYIDSRQVEIALEERKYRRSR